MTSGSGASCRSSLAVLAVGCASPGLLRALSERSVAASSHCRFDQQKMVSGEHVPRLFRGYIREMVLSLQRGAYFGKSSTVISLSQLY